MVRSTSKYVAASLALGLAVAGGAAATQMDYGEAMRLFQAHSAEGTCEYIPDDQWNTLDRNGVNQACSGLPLQSIAGDSMSVANYVGEAFKHGAHLLVNGEEKICITDDGTYFDNVVGACWPSGIQEEPEEMHAVRVLLHLPLQCVDASDYSIEDVYSNSVDWFSIPQQSYLVSGEVALCAGIDWETGRFGEDQRSYIGAAVGDYDSFTDAMGTGIFDDDDDILAFDDE
mmetsp:Transcript_6044/g.14723  ORF Transcript_6044/g.14723 Transcript_6044/m.14723 type:complete len:229 (+) Transcript_6044:107-793(+)